MVGAPLLPDRCLASPTPRPRTGPGEQLAEGAARRLGHGRSAAKWSGTMWSGEKTQLEAGWVRENSCGAGSSSSCCSPVAAHSSQGPQPRAPPMPQLQRDTPGSATQEATARALNASVGRPENCETTRSRVLNIAVPTWSCRAGGPGRALCCTAATQTHSPPSYTSYRFLQLGERLGSAQEISTKRLGGEKQEGR